MLIEILGFVLILIIWVILVYNRLVKFKVFIDEGWSSIDVQLKRRYDLISNLVEVVKGYGIHEKEIFENIAKMRALSMGAVNIDDKSIAEIGLVSSLKSLFAIAENYPELKANQNFLNLQSQLVEIENDIQLARRYYNGSVRNYNLVLVRFPAVIIAKILGFQKISYFEVLKEDERGNIKIKF